VEVPYLGLSAIWCLDDHVSVVDQIEISVGSHLRNNVEISFNDKSESFVLFTLLWLRVVINIDDVPLLSEFISSVGNLDVSVLVVSVDTLVLNFNNLSFLVDDESALESEQLPPS
jgi:hypothetical protein